MPKSFSRAGHPRAYSARAARPWRSSQEVVLTISSHEPRTRGTLILTRSDVAAALTIDDCIVAVEDAFRLHAAGRTLGPGVLGVPATDGGFHIKAAGLKLERTWFAVKCNGN